MTDAERAELIHWARRVSNYVRVCLEQGRDLRRVLDDTAYVFADRDATGPDQVRAAIEAEREAANPPTVEHAPTDGTLCVIDGAHRRQDCTSHLS